MVRAGLKLVTLLPQYHRCIEIYLTKRNVSFRLAVTIVTFITVQLVGSDGIPYYEG